MNILILLVPIVIFFPKGYYFFKTLFLFGDLGVDVFIHHNIN